MDNSVLYSKLAMLPESMKSEVADFIDFLLSKANKEKPENKPKEEKKSGPRFGSMKGLIIMKPDFDEPLEDFKEYM